MASNSNTFPVEFNEHQTGVIEELKDILGQKTKVGVLRALVTQAEEKYLGGNDGK